MTSGREILGGEVVLTAFSESRVLIDRFGRTVRLPLFFFHGLFMDNLVRWELFSFLFGVGAGSVLID